MALPKSVPCGELIPFTLAEALELLGSRERVGGGHGYYAANWLWHVRGFLDRLVGGPGLRRGRRDPVHVAYGDALDFWRVTGVEPDRRMELRAEMRLPGEALLSFEIEGDPDEPRRSYLTQTARFKPRGLLGLAYWYGVLPLHALVFHGMLRGIRRHAERFDAAVFRERITSFVARAWEEHRAWN